MIQYAQKGMQDRQGRHQKQRCKGEFFGIETKRGNNAFTGDNKQAEAPL
jgi:hypothetical protein